MKYRQGTFANRHKRFTEAAFRRYEPSIREILSAYPSPTIIDPSPLSPETFTHRLRDATKAFLESDWNSTITRDSLRNTFAFLGAGGDFILSHDGTLVYAGPRQRTLEVGKPISADLSIKVPGTIDASDFPLINSIALLVNRGLITHPISISNLSPETLATLTSTHPNIELIPQHDSTYLLL